MQVVVSRRHFMLSHIAFVENLALSNTSTNLLETSERRANLGQYISLNTYLEISSSS